MGGRIWRGPLVNYLVRTRYMCQQLVLMVCIVSTAHSTVQYVFRGNLSRTSMGLFLFPGHMI